MRKESLDKDPYRWRKRGALLGLAAAMGSASVGGAQARTEEHPKSTPGLELAYGPGSMRPEAEELDIQDLYNMLDIVRSSVNSHDRVIWDGAIVIEPKTKHSALPPVRYSTAEKNYKARLTNPGDGGPIVISRALIHGRNAIVFDRGGNDEYNTDVDQTDFRHYKKNPALGKYQMIDLMRAEQVGRVSYYSYHGQQPRMLDAVASHGLINPSGKNVLPWGMALDYYEGFSERLGEPLNNLAEWLSSRGLIRLKGYTPPFMR